MKNTLIIILVSLFITTGCAMKQKKVEKELGEHPPVNCATADGDLRLLDHEKANVVERIAEGITALAPAGIVIGVITWTEPTKYRVAVGTYNEMIDKRIAVIKQTCNIN